MIPHEHVGMNLDFKPFYHPLEGFKKPKEIIIIVENVTPLITPRQHMIIHLWIIHANWSSHTCILTKAEVMSMIKVTNEDVTPEAP